MEPQEVVDRLRAILADENAHLLATDMHFLGELAMAIEDESGGSGGPTIRRLASEVRP